MRIIVSDIAGMSLKGSEAGVILNVNGKEIVLSSMTEAWLPKGSHEATKGKIMIAEGSFTKVPVVGRIVKVNKPGTIIVKVRAKKVTLKLKDILGVPFSNAKVTIFLNEQSIKLLSDSKGIVSCILPLGKHKIIVKQHFLKYHRAVVVDESSRRVIDIILPLSLPTLIILTAIISLLILVAISIILLRKERKLKKELEKKACAKRNCDLVKSIVYR